MEQKPAEAYNMGSLDKVLDVLEALGQQERMSLSDIIAATDLPKTTVFRTLMALSARGYVETGPDRTGFQLGIRLLTLCNTLLRRLDVRTIAMPRMRELETQFGDTVNLAVLRNDQVVYVEVLPGHYTVRMVESSGAIGPWYSTSLGKALVAFLPVPEREDLLQRTPLTAHTPNTIIDPDLLREELIGIRQRGYSTDREETELGAVAVGAPILNADGDPVAALSVCGISVRWAADAFAHVGQAVALSARQITQALRDRR